MTGETTPHGRLGIGCILEDLRWPISIPAAVEMFATGEPVREPIYQAGSAI